MSETFTPDNLIAGEFPIVTDEVTIVSGQDLTRGAALGKISASGKYRLTDINNGDGSEAFKCVLAEDCDASLGDVAHVPVYLSGEFNQNAMSFGVSTTAAAVKDSARALACFLKDSVEV